MLQFKAIREPQNKRHNYPLVAVLVPLLGAIPTIDLFPSTSGGYGYGAPEPSYGAPEPSYGAPSDGYGTPARNSWSSAGEYRSVSRGRG